MPFVSSFYLLTLYSFFGDYILDTGNLVHFSDCAVHNEPAYPNEACDCGAVKARKRWWTYFYHLSRIRYARLRSVFRSRLRTLFSLPSSTSNRAPYRNERYRPFDSNGLPHVQLDSSHKHESLLYEDAHDK